MPGPSSARARSGTRGAASCCGSTSWPASSTGSIRCPGAIARWRRVAAIEPGAGVPDGLVVDVEGCIWVALWEGWAVRRYSPDGELLGVVEVPAALVTKPAFGGPDLADLYITTAAYGSPDAPPPPA